MDSKPGDNKGSETNKRAIVKLSLEFTEGDSVTVIEYSTKSKDAVRVSGSLLHVNDWELVHTIIAAIRKTFYRPL